MMKQIRITLLMLAVMLPAMKANTLNATTGGSVLPGNVLAPSECRWPQWLAKFNLAGYPFGQAHIGIERYINQFNAIEFNLSYLYDGGMAKAFVTDHYKDMGNIHMGVGGDIRYLSCFYPSRHHRFYDRWMIFLGGGYEHIDTETGAVNVPRLYLGYGARFLVKPFFLELSLGAGSQVWSEDGDMSTLTFGGYLYPRFDLGFVIL